MGTFDTNSAAALYNNRYDDFGDCVKTVGWGSAASQALRFEVLLRGFSLDGKTILDVGCGLGDLVPYLKSRVGANFRYIGIDVASRLIEQAANKLAAPGIEFICGDLFSINIPNVDISVLSGALSLRVEGMEQYAISTMEKMHEVSRMGASLNFLSKYADFEAEKNQHYQPEFIFEKAKTFTRYVNIFHDYPLYEFTIQLLKERD